MTSDLAASIFRRGSRTYFYSSLFFPAGVRADVVTLYAFVRTADNFVDRMPQDGAGLEAFIRDYRAAVDGETTSHRIIHDFVALAGRCQFEPAWTESFLASMRLDLGKRCYATMAELEEYMWGSAEVIGLMMARILCLPEEATRAATHLGRAMQYINIVRDIGADHALGRTYIPDEIVHARGLPDLSPATVRAMPDRFAALVRAELERYRAWQAEAEVGFRWLPARAAVAIRSASDAYKWTADQIERQPLAVLERQVRPSVARILATGLRLSVAEAAARRQGAPSPPFGHGDGRTSSEGGRGEGDAGAVDAPGAGSWRSFPTFLVRVSRPRFWPYLAGPYLLGFCAGAAGPRDLLRPLFALHLLYFLWPANLFLYGVNDLADADTDRFNPKKGVQEHYLRGGERWRLALASSLSAGIGLALLPGQGTLAAVFLLLFLVLGAGYSLPPLRLKARPGLDSASNVLYAMPGFLGYAQTAGSGPPPLALLGAAAWTAAMHLFSAIPDIAADRAAGLSTTATVLGARASLALCAVLWSVALLSLVALLHGSLIAWLAAAYPIACLALWFRPERTARAYWLFPWLNAASGFVLFVLAAGRLVR